MLSLLAKQRFKQYRVFFLLLLISFSLCIAIMHSFGLFYINMKEGFIQHSKLTDVLVGPSQSQNALFKEGLLLQSSPKAKIPEAVLNKSPYIDSLSPIIFSDSHRNKTVIATTDSFFHNLEKKLKATAFDKGRAFRNKEDIVIGATIAKRFNYKLGKRVELSHGHGHHHDEVMIVSGILNSTGTVLDNCLFIATEAYESIHHLKKENKAQFYWISAKKPIFSASIANTFHQIKGLSALAPASYIKQYLRSFTAVKSSITLCLLALIIVFAMQLISMLASLFHSYMKEARVLFTQGSSLLFITFSFFLDQCLIIGSSAIIGISSSIALCSVYSRAIQKITLFPLTHLAFHIGLYASIIIPLLLLSFLGTAISLLLWKKHSRSLKI